MMALRFPKIVYNNKFSLPSLPPPGTFTGQSILITGATSGLGLATAVHFVNLGASSVIITGRSLFRSEAAKNVIEAQTSTVGKGIVKAMELDMSTFSQTKEFADKMKEEVKEINYVLLNAGCINTSFKLGKEGFEEEIQIHVLSTALLAILLLPWMKLTGRGKAHLGFVTSGRHQGVDIGEWNGWPKVGEIPRPIRWFSEEKHWPGDIYPTSKLLEQYVANEVAKLALGKDGKWVSFYQLLFLNIETDNFNQAGSYCHPDVSW
jgi:NAD(P)-dependent dehydrogenase (short-subunit alcohol dehydrogenase family)